MESILQLVNDDGGVLRPAVIFEGVKPEDAGVSVVSEVLDELRVVVLQSVHKLLGDVCTGRR